MRLTKEQGLKIASGTLPPKAIAGRKKAKRVVGQAGNPMETLQVLQLHDLVPVFDSPTNLLCGAYILLHITYSFMSVSIIVYY